MQVSEAKQGKATQEMKEVARDEGVPIDHVIREIVAGRMIIPRNIGREEIKPKGIGSGLRTKVNANVGTSPDYSDVEEEIKKAKVAVEHGADTIMDLSIGGDMDKTRKGILESIKVPLGTVPIYQAGIEAAEKNGSVVDMSSDDIFNAIRKQAKEGVDFVTVHCGVTRNTVESLQEQGRILNMVSRGGSFLAAWILHNEEENPLYREFDYLLEIAEEFDLTLSLGDAMRPGCLSDASDGVQFQELVTLGNLVRRSRDKDVQTIVEGPGHLPLDQVEANVKLEKTICKGAPFYVLGPLVTDIAPGYDHLVGAIGGALAAWAGADYLCYVTPSEHLCLPNLDDVKKGVIASKIAAHVADVAKGIGTDLDDEIAKARRDFNWKKQFELAIDPKNAEKMRKKRPAVIDPQTCSMCSDFCALKMVKEYLEKD